MQAVGLGWPTTSRHHDILREARCLQLRLSANKWASALTLKPEVRHDFKTFGLLAVALAAPEAHVDRPLRQTAVNRS